jgi:RNA polymerase sigma factor for flagellar operon FliA
LAGVTPFVDTAGLALEALPSFPSISSADICLVDSEELARIALADLLAADAVGFDTESKPSFKTGQVFSGPSVVQLATDTRAYLFQVRRQQFNHVWMEVLKSQLVQKVGFDFGNDRRALNSKINVFLANTVDMSVLLRSPGSANAVGIKAAVAHFFGHRLHKAKRTSTSNWATQELSERQKLYAANDAYVALRVYRVWSPLRGT